MVEKSISELFKDLQEEILLQKLDENINKGIPAEEILEELESGLEAIGEKYEAGDYFLPDLIYASEIMKISLSKLKPLLKYNIKAVKGKVVMGTVTGDIHDIGKDLVCSLLKGSGFEVIDLGVNVSPDKFLTALKESDAKVVGLSVLLTSSFEGISQTVKEIEAGGIREKVSIMIGGAPTSELVREKTGADFYGKNAFDGVKFASKIYKIN